MSNLKTQLTNLLTTYNNRNLIVADADITKFVNTILDYDNANNSNYSDYLYTDLGLCNFDDVKEALNQAPDLSNLLSYVDQIKDATADYYINDGAGAFRNVEVIDLIDFIGDYINE